LYKALHPIPHTLHCVDLFDYRYFIQTVKRDVYKTVHVVDPDDPEKITKTKQIVSTKEVLDGWTAIYVKPVEPMSLPLEIFHVVDNRTVYYVWNLHGKRRFTEVRDGVARQYATNGSVEKSEQGGFSINYVRRRNVLEKLPRGFEQEYNSFKIVLCG
jgi:hypothetical protein